MLRTFGKEIGLAITKNKKNKKFKVRGACQTPPVLIVIQNTPVQIGLKMSGTFLTQNLETGLTEQKQIGPKA